MMSTIEILNNERQHQFEIKIGDYKAELVYRLRKNSLYLLHTFVPEELQHQGLATKLAEHALNYAKANGHLLVVYCPFVAAYVKEHPEWYELYDPNVRVKR